MKSYLLTFNKSQGNLVEWSYMHPLYAWFNTCFKLKHDSEYNSYVISPLNLSFIPSKKGMKVNGDQVQVTIRSVHELEQLANNKLAFSGSEYLLDSISETPIILKPVYEIRNGIRLRNSNGRDWTFDEVSNPEEFNSYLNTNLRRKADKLFLEYSESLNVEWIGLPKKKLFAIKNIQQGAWAGNIRIHGTAQDIELAMTLGLGMNNSFTFGFMQ